RTRQETKAYLPLAAAQVTAAGFPITASTGQASTIDGINYQYFSHPRTAIGRRYDGFFPSGGLKYSFTRNLQIIAAYSYTVSRPSYADLSGAYSISDVTNTITAPNPKLAPEYSNNYSVRTTYYFEPVGSFGIGAFQNDFKNYIQKSTVPGGQGAAAALGYTDPLYDPYAVTTSVNLPGTIQYRGATLEYSQALSFLPSPFNGFDVFANYTRTYTTIKLPDPSGLHSATPYNFGWLPGISPNVVNYGVNYHYSRFTVGVRARWTDKTPYSGTYNSYQKQNTKVDFEASYQITKNLSLYFSMRNVFNVRDYIYANNEPQQIQAAGARGIEYYGSSMYAGIKGKF
ncbi:MAG TPA: TonB-dependent receptor, partial [Opitutaceae bacterium]|nr:TonB-dependent receptor [Opitutaceae bacterium]